MGSTFKFGEPPSATNPLPVKGVVPIAPHNFGEPPSDTNPLPVHVVSGTGINWTGAWDGSTIYQINDAVSDAGSSYICTAPNINNEPPDFRYWDVLAMAGNDTTNLAAAEAYADNGDANTLASAKSYADTGDSDTLSSAATYADTSASNALDAAQNYADTGDDSTLSSANSHSDSGDASTLSSANSHSDANDATTLSSANSHADSGDATTLSTAEAYTDAVAATKQPLDADLTVIAALSTTGVLVRTGANTWALRTLQAPAAGFTISNPAGIAGDPTFALANDLAAVEGLSGTGFAVRTAADTWTNRSIADDASTIQITNGDGVSANPIVAIRSGGVVASLGYTPANQAGDTFGGTVNFPVGSAAAPSAAWNGNYGFAYTTGHVIACNAGAEVARFTTQGIDMIIAGGGSVTFNLVGDGTTQGIYRRTSNDTTNPALAFVKGRGNQAATLRPALNDILGSVGFSGLNTDGAVTTTSGAQVRAKLTETGTVGSANMGSQVQIRSCPIGSGTLSDLLWCDNESGLQAFGANPFLDQNRVVRLRALATSSLPIVTATGLIQASDESGRSVPVYAEGSNYRRFSDRQVASATVDYLGVWASLASRYSSNKLDLIKGAYGKLSDAGLLAKLKGLYVHFLDAQADALVNWITPGTRNLTVVGSPTFTAGQGFTGNGTDGLLNTGATGTNFGASQNSLSAGVYVLAASASAAAVIGQNNAAGGRALYLQSAGSGALVSRLDDLTNDNYTPTKYTGMFVITRGASANYQASVDDSAQTTITRASTQVTGTIGFLGTVDNVGSEFSTAQIAFSFVGTNLSAADIINLRAIMVDYLMSGWPTPVVSYTVANLPPAANFQNVSIYVSDLGGGAGCLRSNGTNWLRENADGYETLGDADKTLISLTNGRNQNLTATLTANRTITLSGTDAKGTTVAKGSWFMIRNSGLGAFTVTIKDGPSTNTITTFASATAKWAKIVFDGTNWQLMADGSI